MPPAGRRSDFGRGDPEDRSYQPSLERYFALEQSYPAASSHKPPTDHRYATRYVPKPMTETPNRKNLSAPYSRPSPPAGQARSRTSSQHTSASNIHPSRIQDTDPRWEPSLSDQRFHSSDHSFSRQQEHQAFTSDIRRGWIPPSSAFPQASNQQAGPCQQQDRDYKRMDFSQSRSFHSDAAFDDFELQDEALAEIELGEGVNEPTPPALPSFPGLIRPKPLRAAGARLDIKHPSSQLRKTPIHEDFEQQRAHVLCSRDLAGLQHEGRQRASGSKTISPKQRRPTPLQPDGQLKHQPQLVETDSEDEVVPLPAPRRKLSNRPADSGPKLTPQELAPLTLTQPRSPASSSSSGGPSLDPRHTSPVQQQLASEIFEHEQAASFATVPVTAPPLASKTSDAARTGSMPAVADGTLALGKITTPPPIDETDSDTNMDASDVDLFHLVGPERPRNAPLPTKTGNQPDVHRPQTLSSRSARRSRSPWEARPDPPQGTAPRAALKKRKISTPSEPITDQPALPPGSTTAEREGFTTINGKLYSDKKLAEWQADGWLGPRDEASFAGKPRWKVASTGYDVHSSRPITETQDAGSLPRNTGHDEDALSRPSTPDDSLPDLPPPDDIDLEIQAMREHDPELADLLVSEGKVERIGAAILGDRFTIVDRALFVDTLRHLAEDPAIPSSQYRFNEQLSDMLEPVTLVDIDEMPWLRALAAFQSMARSRPNGKLFPDATRLRLSWRAQSQLCEMISKYHDSGKYKTYLRAFASIADVKELCTDYDIRAFESTKLRHAMEELRAGWPNLTVHHIHHALDDLPYTMPGISHDAVYDMNSWPFKNEPWTLDWEPSDVDANLDAEVDQLEEEMVSTSLGGRAGATGGAGSRQGRADQDQNGNNTVDMGKKARGRARRAKVVETFLKKEAKAAAQAKRVNTYTAWFLDLARKILQDHARGPRDPPTSWRVTLPKFPSGDRLGNLGTAKKAMIASIRDGLLQQSEGDIGHYPERLMRWIEARVGFVYGPPGTCDGCGKACGSAVTGKA